MSINKRERSQDRDGFEVPSSRGHLIHAPLSGGTVLVGVADTYLGNVVLVEGPGSGITLRPDEARALAEALVAAATDAASDPHLCEGGSCQCR